ncbi:hypothetical protein BAL199_22377 [alpha proteobacterium BAL199]|nr:hypothetical protein BAL199_22377 [alpha proteobacterium BAL199]
MIGSRIQSGITKDELIKFIRDSRNPRIEAISDPKPTDQNLVAERLRKLPSNKAGMLIFIHF